MTDRLRRALPAMAGFALFAAALEVLRYQLAAVTWQALVSDVAATPRGRLAVSLACTAASYVALVGYDLLAFRVIGKALPMANVAFAAFLSYAISNNVGFAMLSGASGITVGAPGIVAARASTTAGSGP